MLTKRRAMNWVFGAFLAALAVYIMFGGYVKALSNGWPVDVQDAAEQVHKMLTVQQRARLRATPRERLVVEYHFGLGLWIRNEFGLWNGNTPLLESACSGNVTP
jgi:hypothetical protein